MSKVVLYATSFYPEMIKWNPLNIPLKNEWQDYSRDWTILGIPNPVKKTNHAKHGGEVLPQNPYVGDWRRIGELGENYIYALGRLVRCPLPYDRTGDWNIFNVLYDPIPEIGNWNMTFPEVCHKRAQELWSEERPIRVWWSGGIDSTTTLTALLLNQPTDGELCIVLS